MAKVGIMGGTFNPIHLGHVSLAKASYEQFGLDKVLFIPSGEPPHKQNQQIAAGYHRARMVELAIRDYPYFELSAIEIDREGYSYTSETLRELHRRNPGDEYYFILGADSLFQMEKWKKASEIFEQCVVLAANRDDIPAENFLQEIDALKEKFHGDIRPIHTPMMHISSTQIREAMNDNRLDGGDEINRNLLDKRVVKYITEHKLYEHEDE